MDPARVIGVYDAPNITAPNAPVLLTEDAVLEHIPPYSGGTHQAVDSLDGR
jgi:hypothetical protein